MKHNSTHHNALLKSLPAELRSLVRGFGSALTEVVEITGLRGDDEDRGGAYRLTFRDQPPVKARVVSRSMSSEFLEATLPDLPADHFPRLLAANSRAIVEEWIEGVSLRDAPVTESILFDCGRLLGTIHSLPCSGKSGSHNTVCYGHWFDSSMFRLLLDGVFDRSLARRIRDIATSHQPAVAEYGVTHRDFCAENLVLREGRIYAIDNLLLAARAFDEDLARTWYRWPLSAHDWRIFLRGYSESRGIDAYERHARYWKMFVLVNAIVTRLRIGGEGAAAVALQRLHTLLDETDESENAGVIPFPWAA